MEYKTINHWDPGLWEKASFVYYQAFGQLGAKPNKIIRYMLTNQLCFLHVIIEETNVIAMAITGKIKNSNALIIDYLAVHQDFQGRGIGYNLVEYIKSWCRIEGHAENIIIEVESEHTPENLQRIRFWENADFQLTDYVHKYIWVPETYQAMYCKLVPNALVPTKGEAIFQQIMQFHKECYRAK